MAATAFHDASKLFRGENSGSSCCLRWDQKSLRFWFSLFLCALLLLFSSGGGVVIRCADVRIFLLSSSSSDLSGWKRCTRTRACSTGFSIQPFVPLLASSGDPLVDRRRTKIAGSNGSRRPRDEVAI